MANFQLTWDIPSSDGNSPIKDYVIQYRQVGSPTWLLYSDSMSTSNTATVEGLAGCLNYEFRIAAKNATGISGFSNNASKILGFIPSGVSNLNVVDSVVVTDISLNVSWSAPSNNGGCTINDYIIEYSTNSGSSWTRVTDGVNNNTSYTITGLSVGTYLVRIAPISVVGIGPFVTSSPITVTTTPPPGVMSIVEQPAHQKAASTSALATFTTQAVSSNGQQPQYQWQLGVRTWSGDIEWTNITGANSNTLTTSIDNLFNIQLYNNDPNFHYGFVRCQTTAISCNTIETEYAILYSLLAFFSPGTILDDFEDSSYQFHDTSSEIVNGISYPLFYVPTFENLGIFQSLFNQYCDSNGITAINFVQDGTKVATVYLQKSLDGINWENAIAPVEIVKNGNICGQDLGPYMNGISYDGNQILYYKSFVEDAWPLNFTSNYLPNNTISSLYSNQQPESVYGPEQDGQTKVKVSWETEELTLCVTNTVLSSVNGTYTGYMPTLTSTISQFNILEYKIVENVWYLRYGSTLLYTSQTNDVFDDWNDTQNDGYPPIVISGICPTTTTTTGAPSSTQLLLHLDATNHYKDFSPNNYSVTTADVFPPTANAIWSSDKKFGDASHNLDYANTSRRNVLQLNNFNGAVFEGNYTIEFWTKLFGSPYYSGFIEIIRSGGQFIYGLILLYEDDLLFINNDEYYINISSLFQETFLDDWCHIAIVNDGTKITIYLNGIDIAAAYGAYISGEPNPLNTIPSDDNPDLYATDNIIYFGYDELGGFEEGLDGLLDEIRISNYAVYTSNFTPPTAPFEP
jgi:hypothetical protein